MWLKFSRALLEGFQYLSRNRLLSVATISVMTLSLFVVGVVVLIGGVFNSAAETAREQLSISLYFLPETSPDEIESIRLKILEFREVDKVSYTSRDQAYEEFSALEQDDSTILEALNEIGENPFYDSLTVVAVNPNDYDLIADQLRKSYFSSSIYDDNYDRNKDVIERLSGVSTLTTRAGLFIGPLLILISLLITYTTIKITLFAAREEFEVKRLVGASNLYVRFPAIVQGFSYGVISAVVATVMIGLCVLLISVSAQDSGLLPTSLITTMFVQYGWAFLLGLLYVGIILGVGSSFFAISRYLKK